MDRSRGFSSISDTLSISLWAGLCLVLLGGCSSTSFVGRSYDNFTAYYNKFHNANESFEKGVESFQNAERSVDRTAYISVFLSPTENSGSESAFDAAIKKSADVLREHPNSKWVDDALLLIGKSYFYQQNYIGAIQKFREVLALGGERAREARFWLARTLVASGSYSEASEVLTVGQGSTPPDNAWTARMHIVQGELLVQQEDWAAAAAALERGLRGDVPDEVASRGFFLLGQVRETLDAPTAARAAYEHVRAHDPSYELDVAARLSEIELQGQHEAPARALERLRALERDDKNVEKQGEIALVKARIYRAQGQPELARQVIREQLYRKQDQMSLSSAAEGRLHYDLATLYRDAFQDFSRAAAHFDTASTTLGTPRSEEEDVQRLPAAPLDAQAQADQYRNLADRAQEVARLDSLLRLGRMEEEEFRAFVQDLREERRAAQEAEREAQMETQRSRQFRTRQEGQARQRAQGATAAQTRESDAGFLFHKDPAQVQEGRRQFRQTWGDRPRVPNWRRRNAMGNVQASGENADQEVDAGEASAAGGEAEARIPGIDLSSVPRDSASQAEMEAVRAVARYELANSLFLAASRPDSAATWYRRILQESGGHPVARRALYALGEAYRAQGDSTAALQTYERLIREYPGTSLAMRARERTGRETDVASGNRTSAADSAYARGYARWQEGDWRPALDRLLKVAWEFPDTPAAPRALLASGVIYWQRVQEDSLNVPMRPVERFLAAVQRTDSTVTDRPPLILDDPVSRLDSLESVQNDSSAVRAVVGSLRASTASMPAGSSAGAVDTVAADLPESASPGGRVAATDSVMSDTTARARRDPYAPLAGLLTHLTESYPDAPQVQKAESMLTRVAERRGAQDSSRADTTVAGAKVAGGANVDSTSEAQGRPQPDSALARNSSQPVGDDTSGTEEARAPLPGPSSTANPGGRPPEDGRQWTLVIDRFSSRDRAQARIDSTTNRLQSGQPVDVVRDGRAEGDQYLLVVGRFSTEMEASDVQRQLERELSRTLEVHPLPDQEP